MIQSTYGSFVMQCVPVLCLGLSTSLVAVKTTFSTNGRPMGKGQCILCSGAQKAEKHQGLYECMWDVRLWSKSRLNRRVTCVWMGSAQQFIHCDLPLSAKELNRSLRWCSFPLLREGSGIQGGHLFLDASLPWYALGPRFNMQVLTSTTVAIAIASTIWLCWHRLCKMDMNQQNTPALVEPLGVLLKQSACSCLIGAILDTKGHGRAQLCWKNPLST